MDFVRPISFTFSPNIFLAKGFLLFLDFLVFFGSTEGSFFIDSIRLSNLPSSKSLVSPSHSSSAGDFIIFVHAGIGACLPNPYLSSISLEFKTFVVPISPDLISDIFFGP